MNFDMERFHCHACGVAGDIFDVVMQAEGMDFKEAREWLMKNCIDTSESEAWLIG